MPTGRARARPAFDSPLLAAPQALGRRLLTQPPGNTWTFGSSTCGSSRLRGPACPAQAGLCASSPARPGRAPRAHRVPGRPVAQNAPARFPPLPLGPRSLAPSPPRLPCAPSGPFQGGPEGLRTVPRPGLGRQPRSSRPCTRYSRRRRGQGSDPGPRTRSQVGGKRRSGGAPEEGTRASRPPSPAASDGPTVPGRPPGTLGTPDAGPH